MRTMTFPLPYEIIAPGGYVMDKITHKVRCEQWTAIINECLASGMPKTTWCRANGISDKQFFYWQRILRQEAYLKVLLLLLLHLFSMIKKNKLLIQHLLRYVLMRCQRSNLPFSDQMLLSVLEIW